MQDVLAQLVVFNLSTVYRNACRNSYQWHYQCNYEPLRRHCSMTMPNLHELIVIDINAIVCTACTGVLSGCQTLVHTYVTNGNEQWEAI